MNEKEFDQEFDLQSVILKVINENSGLLERIGSDFDENGVAYWEKWENMECECGKLKCPNCSETGK